MIRVVGLEQHPAGAVAAAGASRDLQQQLGHALGGAKVDAEQPAVGVEDRHQGDVREVVSFREHLGADDDVDVAGMHAIEQRFQRTAAARCIAVHPGDAQAVDPRLQGARDALGAEPETAHVLRAAPGAFGDRRAHRRAVVAAQPPVLAMEHQMRIAPLAIRDPAARMAYQPGRVPTPVDEQERLLRSGLRLLDRFDEHVAQAAVERPGPQIDHVDARRRGPRRRDAAA